MKKFVFIFPLAVPAGISAQTLPVKPNIVFILADDLGYGDLGSYGSTKIKTPNIDKLAQGGSKFSQFYANSGVCCPTRAAFVTGRYSRRVGIDEIISISGTSSQKGLAASEITIAELLKSKSYKTGIIGKWPLGHQTQYNPTLHGFDYWYGVWYSNNYNGGQIPLMRGTEVIENPADLSMLTHNFTSEAVNFINQNKNIPFFLYLAYTAPHAPLVAHPDFAGKSLDGTYGDVVEEMDWGVGQVVAEIDKLGLRNNTLIVFASDNGPAIANAPQGGSAGPLYCGKGTYYEGGIRVPFIANWPGFISSGRTVDKIGAIFDLYPTFAKLTGAALPMDRAIDGQDLSSVIFGNGERPDDDIAFTWLSKNKAVIAGKWKLMTQSSGGQTWMAECGMVSNPQMLFNLASDIGEKNNLSSQHPQLVSFLSNELTAAQNSLNQPGNQPPVANFSVSPGINALTVNFNAGASSDRIGTVSKYTWNFDDGTSSNSKEVSHTYSANGKYFVTLTVEDNLGLTDGRLYELTMPLSVTASPTPPATKSPTPTSPAGKAGDANGDGKVDGLDYVVWLNNYNKTVTTGAAGGDFDKNGKADGLDYVIWLNNYNK